MHEGLLSFGAHVAKLHPVLVLVVLPGGWGGEVLVMCIDEMDNYKSLKIEKH